MLRQRHDYSCGLAALGTLLTHYYGTPVSEQALLERLLQLRADAGTPAAPEHTYATAGVALADLALLARDRGLRAAGLRVPPTALMHLKRPVIVYLEARGWPHFAVLRGVDGGGRVQLADPAAGNRRLTRSQFAREFVTLRGGRGRVLVLDDPAAGGGGQQPGYFL